MTVEQTMARITEVEVKSWHDGAEGRSFGWHTISVKDGLRLQENTFRCPECLGRVRLRQAAAEPGSEAYADHYAKNKGCSLGDCFDGTKKPHPKPIQ
jgi:hypothetical protein